MTPYLSTSQALPAPVHAHAHAAVADLQRGSVGHLQLLLVVLEHLRGLDVDIPGARGDAILGAVYGLAGIGCVCPGRLASLGKGFQLVLHVQKKRETGGVIG